VLIAAESGFATSLYDLSRNVVHEFVVLSRHCLEGGQPAVETMLQDRLVSNNTPGFIGSLRSPWKSLNFDKKIPGPWKSLKTE